MLLLGKAYTGGFLVQDALVRNRTGFTEMA